VSFVAQGLLPISIIDNLSFRDLFSELLTPLGDNVLNFLPHRTKLSKEITRVYHDEKEKLMRSIDSSVGLVHVVMDGWSSTNQTGYLGTLFRI
jgi:hypothetical protein